jgi:hypothetical protein
MTYKNRLGRDDAFVPGLPGGTFTVVLCIAHGFFKAVSGCCRRKHYDKPKEEEMRRFPGQRQIRCSAITLDFPN